MDTPGAASELQQGPLLSKQPPSQCTNLKDGKLLTNWIQQSTGNGYTFLIFFFFFFTEALDGLPFATERIGGCPSDRAELKAKDNMSRMNALLYTDETLVGKDTCTPMFIASLFTTSKTW